MRKITFEFEQPLIALQEQIDALKSTAAAVDMHSEIESLTRKLETLRKEIYQNLRPWDRVRLARHPNRPYSLDYIHRIFTDFTEFHGDRRYADDEAIVGGFALLDKRPVMVIGTQKGRDSKENFRRNFGSPFPEGYRKALRLMQLADLAGIPIVTLIDTAGAFPGVAAEERHIGEAIAVNLREMFGLNVPIVSIVIGEGGSGGALGLACGNTVAILENAYYSVISPEGCAAILWKDRQFSEKAAENLRLTANDLKRFDIVDEIIPEPLGGAHMNYDEAAANVRKFIVTALRHFERLDAETLKAQRYDRFRHLGRFIEG